MREKGKPERFPFLRITYQGITSSHHLQQCLGHFGRRRRYTNSRGLKRLDFCRSRAFAAADDCARMAHATSGRSSRASDEARHRLFAILINPLGSFFFGRAADFADHNNTLRLRIGIEHFDDVQVRRAVHRIAANADAGGLTDASTRELSDGFVGQGAAARDNTNLSFFVDVARSDADAAAAVRIFSFARCNDAWAVGTDEARLFVLHGSLDFDHVIDRNAFGDTDNQIQSSIDAFEDGVSRKRRRHKNSGSSCAGLLCRFGDSIKDWHFVFEKLAAFARRDASDDLGAVGEAELGVPRAKAAGDALDEKFGLWSYKDGH